MRLSLRTLGTTLALILAVAPASAHGQHFPDDIEGIIAQRVEEERAVGIVVGVMEADGSTRIVTAGSAGEGAMPLGAESGFEIGSITKVFTGTLLAILDARGVVDMNAPVQDYLPAGVTMPARPGQTIRLVDLATHRSGLPRLPGNMAPRDMANPYADYTVAMMYDFLSEHELTRDVGAEAEYSNLGVGLLGHVLARAAGTDYETLVHDEILAPLGMSSTSITLDDAAAAAMAKGHDTNSVEVPLWDLPTVAGAGALRSNMQDMLRFLAANVGAPSNSVHEGLRAAHEPREVMGQGTEIGLNWITRSTPNGEIVWHNGGTGGFRTFMGFDPAREVGVVVLTNSGHGADDIGFHLIDSSLGLTPAPTPPTERVEVAVAAEILERYVGEYELAPNFSIVVTMNDGALFVQATGQPQFPIFAESDTEFFLRVVDAQVTFVEEDGVVTSMILHQGGADQPARKIN
ncbi:MAG: serine hydrolase [Gemmatimonadota bacterium]